MIRLLVPTLAALAIATPAAASADGPFATTSVSVSSAGLALDRTSDAGIMASRLDRGAMGVCGASRFSARDVQTAVRRSACYRDAMEQALASLNAPAVTAAVRGRALVADVR
jgi:UrcA family protein